MTTYIQVYRPRRHPPLFIFTVISITHTERDRADVSIHSNCQPKAVLPERHVAPTTLIAGVSTARVTESRVRSVESRSLSAACESQPRTWQFQRYGSHSFQEHLSKKQGNPSSRKCQVSVRAETCGLGETNAWLNREWTPRKAS
jgi:hypothetical protein